MTGTPRVIDCGVHPVLGNGELGPLVGAPWNLRLPPLLAGRAEPPFPILSEPLERAGDPAAALARMDEMGIALSILTPLTRGLQPHPLNNTAVAQATNRWLHDRWLDAPGASRRFAGSIRAPVTETMEAVSEIERWADDPRFVQVAVPLRTPAPYGDERYFPIWEAAAERGLPVFVRDDGPRANTEPPPTPAGAPIHFAEYQALAPLAGFVHLSSLITSGVFERLPELVFIFGDGGVDLAMPMLWRLDKDWRQGRNEVPWVSEPPSSYLRKHVRFVSQLEDGRPDGRRLNPEQLRVSQAAELVLFGSHYPFWDRIDPAVHLEDWPEPARTNVLAVNAQRTYPRLAAMIPRAAQPARAGSTATP